MRADPPVLIRNPRCTEDGAARGAARGFAFFALSLPLTLSACGAGGGDGKPIPPPTSPEPPAAPEPQPEPEPVPVTGIEVAEVGPDFIRWTWDPLVGVLSYQALV